MFPQLSHLQQAARESTQVRLLGIDLLAEDRAAGVGPTRAAEVGTC